MDKAVSVASLAGWNDVMKLKVKKAVVFCDEKMAQVFHWIGGMRTLLEAGAQDVREFSSFESGSENQKKGVFLIQGPLEGVTQKILQDILTQSHFQYVVVLTTAHPLLHSKITAASIENGAAFEDFEEQLLEWMGNMNYTSEVLQINLFSCEVCPGFFITPAFSELFPLLPSDLQQINYQQGIRHAKDAKNCDSLNDVEITNLPEDLEIEIRLFSTSLDGLLQAMNVKEEIYSIGCLSRIIATDLDSFPPAKARRKASQSRMSLLLVDRTLDLATGVTSQTEVLLDKIFNALPSLNMNKTDKLVDMTDLCHCYKKSSQSVILPGCLAPPKLQDGPSHLTAAIMKKHKEALMDINRRLVETASSEKLPLDLSRRPSRVTADLLDSTLALFKGKYALIQKHLDILQVATSTSQALKHPCTPHQDAVVAKEKNFLQAIADSEGGEGDEGDAYPSAFALLSKLVAAELAKDGDKREFTLDDFLQMLVYIYSTSDGSSESREDVGMLQDQLVQCVIKDKDCLPPIMKAIVGDKVTESILPDQIESMWERLDGLMEVRRDLKDFGNLLDPGGSMSPASVNPLLRQVMEKILDPSKPEMLDVECKSGGLKDLLKSGFGFFKSSAKPRPGDAPLLMVMVVGGVTGSEVRMIRDMVSSAKPGFEVVVGGTRINTIEATLQSLLVEDNINIHTNR